MRCKIVPTAAPITLELVNSQRIPVIGTVDMSLKYDGDDEGDPAVPVTALIIRGDSGLTLGMDFLSHYEISGNNGDLRRCVSEDE